MTMEFGIPYYELRQNYVLGESCQRCSDHSLHVSSGDAFGSFMHSRHGVTTVDQDTPASTDFGNVCFSE